MENAQGKGMYRAANCRPLFRLDQKTGYERHPAPHQDSGMADRWNALSCEQQAMHLFGFSSVAQLRRWLYTDRVMDHLYNEGVRLSIYEVPDNCCIVGLTQGVFLHAEATLLGVYEDWRVAGSPNDPWGD